jgi:pimeloyl-ACP methyl ester carboxylesterase
LSAAPRRIRTATLDIAYEESGAAEGVPIFLMHGWPYDPRCYDAVIAPLCSAGARVIVPYLRGFGPTRFLSDKTPRSGQQAALGNDLRELMDALAVDRAVLAGYDWGGRAACIVAALWPQRVRGLVTVNSYNIQDIAGSAKPQSPEQERRFWYQWYFQTERGRAGLENNRGALCRLLWELWSPHWAFDTASFQRSAARGNRAGARAKTQNYRAHDCAAGRCRRRVAAGGFGAACRIFRRPLSAARLAADRTQPATGRSANICQRGRRTVAGVTT